MTTYTVYANSRATNTTAEGTKFVVNAVPANSPPDAIQHPAVVRKFHKMGLTHNKFEMSARRWNV